MTKKSIIAIVAGIVFPLYAIAGQPSAQITHGPYLQNLSEDEVTVVWTTDKPCNFCFVFFFFFFKIHSLSEPLTDTTMEGTYNPLY